MSYKIVREIGIDMGHRVTHHGSKCKNLHGHRYTVHAVCAGPLFSQGEQEGMVLDFSFLKEEMMNEIDAPCDHGTCLWIDDPFVYDFLHRDDALVRGARQAVNEFGHFCTQGAFGKLYLVNFVPTAENLAKHWSDRLGPKVKERTGDQAHLVGVQVWETPNCSAQYPSNF